MKTLVIPDVHQRVEAVKTILAEENDYDQAVFLGDWFDSFFDPPQVAGFEETCQYLKHLVLEHPERGKFKFLAGNHDVCYIHENRDFSHKAASRTVAYYCSGFTASKAKKFRHAFFDRGLRDAFFLEHFALAHTAQGFTISHAGIDTQHIPYGGTVETLVKETLPKVWKNFRTPELAHNWLLSGVGYCRGGRHKIGGVTWLDWHHEFVASEHTGRQIVGHTTVEEPRCMHPSTAKECWNLDTERHYGVIVNGEMAAREIPAKRQTPFC